jgi:pimeloyl-ACP methyl ester carboxylesterase
VPRIDGINYVYPGAQRPARTRRVDAHGIGIAVYEWGPRDGRPIAMIHGGFDFAATFDLLAPLLVEEGFRPVAWDQRGHGESSRAALYSWQADLRDASVVLATLGSEPVAVVGHSKGGMMAMFLAAAQPERVSHVVNIDGVPSTMAEAPDVSDADRQGDWAVSHEAWLDRRRASAVAKRKPGSIDDLARRRQRLNPRLPIGWLRYLAAIGSTKDADGHRWKLDPSIPVGGFGPRRPQWALQVMSSLTTPMLAMVSTEPEPMGWHTDPADVPPYLPPQAQLEVIEGGHFLHLEQPEELRQHILQFVGSP